VSLSASEFYEAGASESWLRTAAAASYDALKADPSRAVPAEDVRNRFEARWAARS